MVTHYVAVHVSLVRTLSAPAVVVFVFGSAYRQHERAGYCTVADKTSGKSVLCLIISRTEDIFPSNTERDGFRCAKPTCGATITSVRVTLGSTPQLTSRRKNSS